MGELETTSVQLTSSTRQRLREYCDKGGHIIRWAIQKAVDEMLEREFKEGE